MIDGSTEAERAAREVQRREQAAEAARREQAEAAARAATWDAEEVRLLEKALVKFPVVSHSFSRAGL